jgi:hypothetical protein
MKLYGISKNKMSFQKSKWISGNQIDLRKTIDLPYIEGEGGNTHRAICQLRVRAERMTYKYRVEPRI